MKVRVFALITLVLLLAAPMACAKPVSKVKIEPATLNLDAGVSQDLMVSFKPASASPQLKWKSSNTAVATVDDDGVVTAVAPGKATISCRTKNGKSAKCKVVVRDPNKVVALTFDDGPCDNTLKILDILRKYNVKVTFFMLGDLAQKNPSIASKVAEDGHEIGSHTVDHKSLQKLSLKEAIEDLDKSFTMIEEASGVLPTLVRAPYGAIDENLAKALEHPFIQWSVDTLDWKSRNANSVYKEVMKSVKSGSIILMHDLYSSTTEAVRLVVPELLNQGYSFVTVSELIERRGIEDATGMIIY